jgi:hypothetical protein
MVIYRIVFICKRLPEGNKWGFWWDFCWDGVGYSWDLVGYEWDFMGLYGI